MIIVTTLAWACVILAALPNKKLCCQAYECKEERWINSGEHRGKLLDSNPSDKCERFEKKPKECKK